MDCSLPGSNGVHGMLQARILEWVGIPFSRWSSRPRDCTQVSGIVGRFFTELRYYLLKNKHRRYVCIYIIRIKFSGVSSGELRIQRKKEMMDNFNVLKILSVRVTYLCMWVFKSPLAAYRKCQASVCSLVLSHHSKDLEWRTLKPPRRVTALGSWTDHVIALRSRMDRVIALREISVTILFYLEDSRKIHLRAVRAHRFKDTKRRAPHHAGERERVREREISGSGRAPGEGNGSPLQYSCLENPMDCRPW